MLMEVDGVGKMKKVRRRSEHRVRLHMLGEVQVLLCSLKDTRVNRLMSNGQRA